MTSTGKRNDNLKDKETVILQGNGNEEVMIFQEEYDRMKWKRELNYEVHWELPRCGITCWRSGGRRRRYTSPWCTHPGKKGRWTSSR